MRVLVCAGGTGGGIYPALAAITELRRLLQGEVQLLWIGTQGEMEEDLVPRAGFQLETISGGGIAGVPLRLMVMNGVRLGRGLLQAIRLIGRFGPSAVFITGGYVAVPIAIAAQLRRTPIVIFLPDVEPGSAIRMAARFARKIACTTEESAAYLSIGKMVVTGYPVRAELRAAVSLERQQALARFNLKPGRPTLFVFGGSRGARSINRALMSILPQLLSELQVIHVSGNLTWPEVAANASGLAAEHRAFYRPFPYLHEDMGAAFRCADLVVARAGASMLGESPAFGLPSILVPYPHAWRYQKVNADYLADRAAAVQIADERLSDELLPTVTGLLRNKERLAQMAGAAARLDRPNAAADLARLIAAVGAEATREVQT